MAEGLKMFARQDRAEDAALLLRVADGDAAAMKALCMAQADAVPRTGRRRNRGHCPRHYST